MARSSERKRVSVKPSEAEAGGSLGFPSGSIVLITEAEWSTWGEAGEKALKNNRKADDPALKLVGEIEGIEEPRTVFLGAGKGTRMEPSRDGQFLEVADGSTATALNDQCNAKIFLDSIFYKDKKSEAFKRHGKDAISEDVLDDGINDALAGLKFVAGSIIVQRDIDDGDPDRKRKNPPSLVCDKILEAPGEAKPSSSKRTASKKKDEDEDEDEEDARPARRKRPARDEEEEEDARPAKRTAKKKPADEDEDEDEGEDDNEAAEKAVLEALEQPKWKKGLPKDKAFGAAFNLTKGEKNQKAITDLVEDENWITSKKRPWVIDEDDVIQAG